MEETETGNESGGPARRTVLKTAGAGTAGAAMLAGRSAAQHASKMSKDNETKNSDEEAIFLILFEHTVRGKEQIEGVPQAVQEAQPLLEELGAEQQALYFGSIGEYDGFGIATFPSREAAETFRLTLERDGTHELEVYEIWEAEEYFELIGRSTTG